MNATRTRIARAAAGIALIAAATAGLAWLVFQFVPGTPRAPQADADDYGASIAGVGNDRYTAETIVDIPFGQTFLMEGVTRGKWFSTSEEERASLSDEERERLLGFDSTLYDIDGIEITPESMKAVTVEAFAEWYPHYSETTGGMEALQHEGKIILVDVTMTNTTDQAQRMPPFTLWSEDFNGADDVLDNGVGSDAGYALEELYGVPSDRGLVQYSIPEDWFMLQAGETRTWTSPCLVYKALFKDPAAYDDIDPSRFCLAIADYDPPTIYRLWLG